MTIKNPIICVDFDGVIHDYKKWKGASVVDGEPIPGAINFLLKFLPTPDALGAFDTHSYHRTALCTACVDNPVDVICKECDNSRKIVITKPKPIVCIYSARSKSWKGRRAMKKWLVKHGLDAWYIKDKILKFPKKKPAAFLTLDDRAICFKGVFPTLDEIVNFKSWQHINWDGTGVE